LPDGRDASLQDNTVQQIPRGKEQAVEPRVSLVTLGVSDLERAIAFYREGLGWPKSGVGGDEVALFKTSSGR
jgi:predicted enzyme related to lactoylglutathione lyase